MAGERYGLVIGNTHSIDPAFRRLKGPALDVSALARVLGNPEVGRFAVTELLDRPSFETALAIEELLADRRRDDLVLLYFSGHAVKDDRGQLCFLATNSLHNRLASTTISSTFIRDCMQECLARQQIIILDCCFGGAFSGVFKGPSDEDGFTTASGEYFRAEGKGQVILTASDSMQYAFEADQFEGDTTRGSVFTGMMVDGLETGKADLNADGYITVNEVYYYISDQMRQRNDKQTPMMSAFGLEGEIILAWNSQRNGLPKVVEDLVSSELSSLRLAAVSELLVLLNGSDPNAVNTAKQTLLRLTQDDSRKVAAAASAALADQALREKRPLYPSTIEESTELKRLNQQASLSERQPTNPIGKSPEVPVNYVLRKSPKPLFISYAHTDNEGPNERDRWLNRLIEFLAPLVSEGLSLCSDQTLGIGDNWHDRIQKDLDEAKAAIILISPAFLGSEYIRNSELPIILKNAADRGVKIFPIIIKPCLFGRAKYKYPDPEVGPNEFSIASLQAANPPSRTLIEMTEGEQNRVFESVAEEIAKLLDR